jgi:EpsG family
VPLVHYAIVLIGCCILLILARTSYYQQQQRIAHFCVFLITLFAATRGYVGTDTYSYHLIFVENGPQDIVSISKVIEPLFAVLIKVTALIFSSSFVFVALVSIIQGIILVKLVNTSKNPVDFLMIYIAVFYLNFSFNILRAGTAVLLLVLANRIQNHERNKVKFYLFGVAAVLTHYSALIGFLPMIYMRQIRKTTKFLAVALIVIAAVLMYYFMLSNEALYGKYMVYSEAFDSNESQATSKSFIFSLPLYLMLYISVVNRKNLLGVTSLFLVWFLVRWTTSQFMLVGRIEIIVNALLLFSVIEYSLISWRGRLRSIALVGLTVMWLYGTLTVLGDEGSLLAGSAAQRESYLMSPFNPYKFFWEEY